MTAYGPSYPDLYRRAAAFVDRIFKGEKPAEVAVEQPTKFESMINLKAAKVLGLGATPIPERTGKAMRRSGFIASGLDPVQIGVVANFDPPVVRRRRSSRRDL